MLSNTILKTFEDALDVKVKIYAKGSKLGTVERAITTTRMEALCRKMVLKEKEVEIPLQFYPDSFAYQCQINSLYVQSKQDEPVITRSMGYHIPLSTAMTAGFFDYGVTSYQSWEDPSEQKTKMEPRVRSGVVAGIDKLTFTLKIWPVGKDKSTIFSVHINRFKVVDMPQSVKQTLNVS